MDGTIDTSRRYFITSLSMMQLKKTVLSIREHWAIENRLHYKLDVGLHEDACQIYRGFADQNLAIMRKIVLKLLEDTESKHHFGIAMKRQQAALDYRFLRTRRGL